MRKARAPRWMRRHHFSILGKYHQALVLAKEIRHDEKRLHKMHKHMFHRYSEDVINELNERKEHQVEKHPDKTKEYDDEYDHRLRELAKEFLKDFEEWIDELMVVYEKLDKMVEFDDRAESDDLLRLGQVLHESSEYKGQFIFTEKNISRFKKAYHHFERKLVHDMKQDYRNDKREEDSKDPKRMGYFRIHKSDTKLAKALRNAAKRFSEDDQQMKAIADRVEQQLKEGVKPDFITLFEGYIDEFALVERAIKIIREDVREIIVHHVHEDNKVSRRTYMFSAAIHPVFDEIHVSKSLIEKLDAFENGKDGQDPVGKKAIEFANLEMRAERALYGELKRDHHEFKRFLHRIEGDKKEVHHDFEQSARAA